MASSRVPGPTCVTTQTPIDSRTLQRAPTPPPGPVSLDAGQPCLGAADIQSLRLFETSLKNRSLEELQSLRFQNEQLYKQAVTGSGTHSWHAAFWASSLDILDKRIALLQTGYGKSKQRLQDLVDAMKKGTAVKDDDVKKAIGDLLTAEREKPQSASDGGDESAMPVVAEAVKEVSRIRNKQFKELLERAKRPGAKVTDDQIKHGLENVLGPERQKQLLGIEDDNPETMNLVADALDFSHERRKAGLSDLLDKAKSGKQKVSKEQVQAQVVQVLETARERQLLGISDPVRDQGTDELIDEARKVMSTVEVTIGPVTLNPK